MNVSLTPYFEAMIREKVASGRYNNASEVVREALRLLEAEDRRKLERLQAMGAIRREQREIAPDGSEAPGASDGPTAG